MSCTPVREALRRLEAEGLVARNVHRGATVARTEPEDLAENYRILAALEALAGTLTVPKISDGDIAEVEDLYQQVAACDPGDERLAELNRRFHFRIYECARSPMLLLLLMRLLWRSFPAGPQAGRPAARRVGAPARAAHRGTQAPGRGTGGGRHPGACPGQYRLPAAPRRPYLTGPRQQPGQLAGRLRGTITGAQRPGRAVVGHGCGNHDVLVTWLPQPRPAPGRPVAVREGRGPLPGWR